MKWILKRCESWGNEPERSWECSNYWAVFFSAAEWLIILKMKLKLLRSSDEHCVLSVTHSTCSVNTHLDPARSDCAGKEMRKIWTISTQQDDKTYFRVCSVDLFPPNLRDLTNDENSLNSEASAINWDREIYDCPSGGRTIVFWLNRNVFYRVFKCSYWLVRQ